MTYLVIAAVLLGITFLITVGMPSLDTNLVNIVLIQMMSKMNMMMIVDNPAPGFGISGLLTN